MPNVIKHWNDPRHAVTLSGHTVERQEAIYLKTHERAYQTLPTSMHFVYRDPTVVRGSTLLCTCGAPAGVFGFEAYRKWSSYIASDIIACTHFIQYGVHSDGSHE